MTNHLRTFCVLHLFVQLAHSLLQVPVTNQKYIPRGMSRDNTVLIVPLLTNILSASSISYQKSIFPFQTKIREYYCNQAHTCRTSRMSRKQVFHGGRVARLRPIDIASVDCTFRIAHCTNAHIIYSTHTKA